MSYGGDLKSSMMSSVNWVKSNPWNILISIAIVVILVCLAIIIGVAYFPNSDCSVNMKNVSNSTKVVIGALVTLLVALGAKSIFSKGQDVYQTYKSATSPAPPVNTAVGY